MGKYVGLSVIIAVALTACNSSSAQRSSEYCNAIETASASAPGGDGTEDEYEGYTEALRDVHTLAPDDDRRLWLAILENEDGTDTRGTWWDEDTDPIDAAWEELDRVGADIERDCDMDPEDFMFD